MRRNIFSATLYAGKLKVLNVICFFKDVTFQLFFSLLFLLSFFRNNTCVGLLSSQFLLRQSVLFIFTIQNRFKTSTAFYGIVLVFFLQTSSLWSSIKFLLLLKHSSAYFEYCESGPTTVLLLMKFQKLNSFP